MFICGSFFPLHATTVTGALTDAQGQPIATGLVIFRLSQFAVANGVVLVNQPAITCTITAGVVDQPCTVTGNDQISPAGTYYLVRVTTAGGVELIAQQSYSITGASFDLGAAAPLLANPAPGHTHDAADVTAGTLPLVRGGTNQIAWTAGRCVQVAADGSQLESAAAACGTGGGGGATHQVNGLALTAQDPVNLQDSTEIAFSNPSAGNLQAALVVASVADSKLASAYSGVGACPASEFVTGASRNAAPACAQPGFVDLSGSTALSQLPAGGANQLLKTNAVATALEHATLAVGTAGTDFAVAFAPGSVTLNLPTASASARGALNAADWSAFNAKENALTFSAPLSRSVNAISCPTCESTANKDAASGYAGLTAAAKLNAAQGQEVWSVADLADFSSKSGAGFTALGATITAPASNHYLGWSGTDWVNRPVAFSELSGTAADAQIPAAISRDSESPAAGDISGSLAAGYTLNTGAVGAAALADAYHTFIHSFAVFDPTTADTNKLQHKFPNAVTLTRLSCSTDAGTVSINFDERAEATPNTAGSNVLAAPLVCDTNSQVTATFSDAAIAANAPLNLQVTAASGIPGVVRIHLEFRVN